MIVDDSREIRLALRQIAERCEHAVVAEAENGKAALELFPDVQPELVLLDVSMPVMGGFATARELRRIAPELPVLFVSQQAGPDYVDQAFRLGARGYLLKSVIHSELSQAIEAVGNNQLYRSARLAS